MAQDDDAARKSAKILADDKEHYPDYKVSFDGDLVETPISIRGPHSFQLAAVAPDVIIKVVLSRKDADPGVPNLNITIRRKRPGET